MDHISNPLMETLETPINMIITSTYYAIHVLHMHSMYKVAQESITTIPFHPKFRNRNTQLVIRITNHKERALLTISS